VPRASEGEGKIIKMNAQTKAYCEYYANWRLQSKRTSAWTRRPKGIGVADTSFSQPSSSRVASLTMTEAIGEACAPSSTTRFSGEQ